MGLSKWTQELLLELMNGGNLPLGGNLIEIGAQQLGSTFVENTSALKEMADILGKDVFLPKPFTTRDNAETARRFWEWMGYNYKAIDFDNTLDSPLITLDLNYDKVPRKHRKKYSVVTNFGSTEHTANQINAFKIIHDLTAKDGIMIHMLPSHGHMNHGLVNYNAKFFWMLCRSNLYEPVYFDFITSSVSYPMPENIIDFIKQYGPAKPIDLDGFSTSDSTIRIVLRKKYDIGYVPPLDVADNISVENKKLRQRYWTVFQPEKVQRLVASYV